MKECQIMLICVDVLIWKVYVNDLGVPRIYVADTNNHIIRKLNYQTGRTVTVAGSPRTAGTEIKSATWHWNFQKKDSSGKDLSVS